ncbi:MAG: FecR family protein [Candidatus Puniceispirillaceae bacterium]
MPNLSARNAIPGILVPGHGSWCQIMIRVPARHAALAMLSLLSTLAISSSAIAAEFIGVAAALRGDVIRVAATSGGGEIGPVSSGTHIFLGDEIEVASGGRMQIMLLDETVFTLGSGARLIMDEFVYDPATQSGAMTTQITRGAFRFVSGKLAKSSPEAMKVKLPSASISIRGTQVAGIVDEEGGSKIVLVGPGPNAVGAALGAITVSNAFGSVDLIRPNFATSIFPNQPPAPPQVALPETIQQIEQSTGEDAAIEIAAAIGIESLDVVPAVDTDDDGIPDTITGNAALGESIANATDDDTVTSDQAILDAVFAALSPVVADGETDPDDMRTLGVNLGAGAAALFTTGAQYRGDTTIDQLLNYGLTGSTTYSATDVAISCSNSAAAGCGGSYDISDTWNFATGSVRMALSDGTAALDYDGDGTLDTNIGFSMDVTFEYGGSGPLGSSIITTNQAGDIPGYVHVAAEYDSSLNLGAYNVTETTSHIGQDEAVNSVDWTAIGGNSMTVTDQGSGIPGRMVIRNDAFLSNFALGSDAQAAASVGNIASHELTIEKPDASGDPTELATGSVHGMASQ